MWALQAGLPTLSGEGAAEAGTLPAAAALARAASRSLRPWGLPITSKLSHRSATGEQRSAKPPAAAPPVGLSGLPAGAAVSSQVLPAAERVAPPGVGGSWLSLEMASPWVLLGSHTVPMGAADPPGSCGGAAIAAACACWCGGGAQRPVMNSVSW